MPYICDEYTIYAVFNLKQINLETGASIHWKMERTENFEKSNIPKLQIDKGLQVDDEPDTEQPMTDENQHLSCHRSFRLGDKFPSKQPSYCTGSKSPSTLRRQPGKMFQSFVSKCDLENH